MRFGGHPNADKGGRGVFYMMTITDIVGKGDKPIADKGGKGSTPPKYG